MSGSIFAHVRVSSADQNPDRQIAKVGAVDKTFSDHVGGESGALAGRGSHATKEKTAVTGKFEIGNLGLSAAEDSDQGQSGQR